MNYLIWRGKDSRDIKGLVICELPPISKPQMRTTETMVDGVDGSYIEELGYATYDRAVSIGLTQKADMNEISQYFSGSGEVIFSNEPDKYYKASIIGQIDYARLVRFRTATVTFRVQPFKYEYGEKETVLALTQLEGTHISHMNTNTKLAECRIEGYCTQESEPTIDVDAPISTIEESVKVNISGKNILNLEEVVQGTTKDGKTTEEYGILVVSETGIQTTILKDHEAGIFIGTIEITGLKIGTRYTLSGNANSKFSEVYIYKDELWGKAVASGDINNGISFSATSTKVVIGFYSRENVVGDIKTVKNIQFEENYMATEYEEYRGKKVTVNLGDNFIGAVKDVKDTLFIKNGHLMLEKRVGRLTLNGNADEQWVIAYATNYKYFANVKTAEERNGKATTANLLSNRFVQNASYDVDNTIKAGFKWFIQVTCNTIETVEDFKAYLAENNLTVYYELATPYVVDLGEIGAVDFISGLNIISNSKTANMIISYTDDNLLVMNTGNYKSKPVIELQGFSSVELIVNGNKLFRYTFPEGEDTVIVDSQKQDAYVGSILKNRQMIGEFPMLEIGENIITWEGTITEMKISAKSRWL